MKNVKSYPALLRIHVEKHNLSLKGVHGALEGIDISELNENQVNLVKKAPRKDRFKFKTAVSTTLFFPIA